MLYVYSTGIQYIHLTKVETRNHICSTTKNFKQHTIQPTIKYHKTFRTQNDCIMR